MAESILDNPEKLGEIDKGNMFKVISEFPEMLQAAKKLASSINLGKIKNIKQIIVAGMGGSAIGGDIAWSVLSEKINIPITVIRGYSLPKYVGKDTLLIAVSYSGNTEETLSIVKEAENRRLSIISITSGGRLKEVSEAKGYPLIIIPTGIQPRAALPYLLVPMLIILEKLGFAQGISLEIAESVTVLKGLRAECTKEEKSNQVKQLAHKLQGKVPVIFAVTGTTDAVGLRWKTQLNENSKVSALYNAFPELNHNEIVSMSMLEKGKHNFSMIVLRDEGDNERVKKRIEITKSLLGGQVGGVTEVWSKGKSKLARLLSLVYYGDFLSVYLAILGGIDPTPVKVIERLKKELVR